MQQTPQPQTPLQKQDEHVSSPFTASFDAYVNDLLTEWYTPGMAIAVVNGSHTWTKGYGYASLDDKVPVTPSTLFIAASTTKSFTASIAALLVADKQNYSNFEWTTPISSLAREDFVLADSWLTDQVTITDALSHRTGYPRHDQTWINHKTSVVEQVRKLRLLPPSAPLRTKWQYNNMMFIAVSHVIELVTGKSMQDVFDEWLWKPLNMSETYLGLESAKQCKVKNPDCTISKNYKWDERTSSMQEIPLSAMPEASGAGGIVSNVEDYVKWVQSLVMESGPLSHESYETIRSPHAFVPEAEPFVTGPTWYGLGLMGTVYRGHQVATHDGGLGGFYTRMLYLPGQDFGFVIMQNAPTSCMNVVGYRLIDDFLRIPEAERHNVNAAFHEEHREEKERTMARPKELFVDAPSRPLAAVLPMEAYAGLYHHVAYGDFEFKLRTYGESGYKHPLKDVDPSDSILYGEPEYLHSNVVLHHVSGEHWLVEENLFIKVQDVPNSYSKAKFEIGLDGKVDAVKIVLEPSLEGEAAWAIFSRVR
ncbi:hypothetical protein MBLNU457_4587t1 [Dothideomycetes sp. NU457]